MYGDIQTIINRDVNRYQLAKLHTFEVAARYQSFSMAAEELCITPSAVSHQINKLEHELGFTLFKRFHRRIELSDEGQQLFWALQNSLKELNQEIFEIKNQKLLGELVIYSRPSIAQSWLIPRLNQFIAMHPYMRLTLLTGNELINFNRHKIHVAIYYDDHYIDEFEVYELMHEKIFPVCSPSYAQKYGLYSTPQNLEQCTLLHDTQAWGVDSGEFEWQSWCNYAGIKLDTAQSRSMFFDRSDLSNLAAINGLGISIGRKCLVQQYLDNQELIAPFGNIEMPCPQRYYAVTPYADNNKVNVFLDWLKTVN